MLSSDTGKESSSYRIQDVWKRIRREWQIEVPLLRARWKQVLFGAIFQYVHAMSTQLAHRMHKPMAEPLHDIGFEYLPELGRDNFWVSETIFSCLFIPFIFWTFSPFVTNRKRFYTAVLYARLLVVLSLCQLLRIISFTVTQLPAPNYHCRAGEDTAIRPMPEHWWGHILVDLGTQATHGCGDLIFSSHTTFVLVGVLTYTEYGTFLILKVIAWLGAAIMGLCIVASRKHYSVDVVVAWYTVPLVFYAAHRRWTTKRPLQDYWPHRPLMGEDALELATTGSDSSDDVDGKPLLPITANHSRTSSRAGGDGKPLLPVMTAHSRSSSRSAVDLRSLMGGRQPSHASLASSNTKEPASPPPEGADDMDRAVASSKRGVRPRQNSIVQILQETAGGDVEMGTLQNSSGNNEQQGPPPLSSNVGASAGNSAGGDCRLM